MKKRTLIASIVICIIANAAALAETNTYRFVPNQSTVVQTGGFAGVHETYYITGQFQLTVDIGGGTASFDWVDATLSDGPFQHRPSLGLLFNMTELTATTVTATVIEFEGTTANLPGADIHLVLTLTGGSIHLTGEINSPCCDFFEYSLDAAASKVSPGWTYNYFDDFNTDKAKGIATTILFSGRKTLFRHPSLSYITRAAETEELWALPGIKVNRHT